MLNTKRYSKQFKGSKLKKARKYNNIGIIILENGVNNNFMKQISELMFSIGDEFDVNIMAIKIIKQTDLINGVQYVIKKIDKIIRNFKIQNIYRVILPEISSILGPYLNGEFHNNIKFAVREPNLIAVVDNPGTTEVENNHNVWRFSPVPSSIDPLGEINKKFYTQNLNSTGNILILYDNTLNGVDEGLSALLLNSLQNEFGTERVECFALIPSDGKFTNYSEAIALVSELPVGSILVFDSNQTVTGESFLADSNSTGLFENKNVAFYVSDNFDLTGVAPPVRFDSGFLAINFLSQFPNYWTRKFDFPDSITSAIMKDEFWDSRIYSITLIEMIGWLAMKGTFAGIDGDLKFPKHGIINDNKYGQTRIPREIIQVYRPVDSLTDETRLIGLNSLYYDFSPGFASIYFKN